MLRGTLLYSFLGLTIIGLAKEQADRIGTSVTHDKVRLSCKFCRIIRGGPARKL